MPEIIDFSHSKKIVGIAAGKTHTLAWDSEGRLYSWGDGSNGKLGHKYPEVKNTRVFREDFPRLVNSLRDCFVISGACADGYSAVITSKGVMYGWGRGT